MRFSVIIPTYNRADLLATLLSSLQAQTFKDFELIICDDGSTDHTAEVVRKFSGDFQMQYLYLTNNGGPAEPRNRGIAAAKGEYCAFLDSDDSWYPDKLSVVNSVIEKGYDWVYHQLDIFSNSKFVGLAKANTYNKADAVRSLLINFNPIPTSSMVVNTRLLKQVGNFRTEISYHFVEDFDYWLRLVQVNTNSFAIQSSLGIYNDHAVNNSKSVFQAEKLGSLYDKYNEELKSSSVDLAKYYAQFIIAYQALNKNFCRKILRKMIKKNVLHIYTLKAMYKWAKISR